MSAGSAPVNIVLVHGGFVDGSGWRAVYDLLTQDGYHVAVVQNPTRSLAGDAAATRLIIDVQDGPVVLVGHSYGGAVITEAGTGDKVAALVYVAAFAPDKGEAVNALIADPPPGAPVPPILPPHDGFLFLDWEKFHASFAGDLPAADAAFMADSQVPWGVDALGGMITEPAWRARPSWYLLTTEDRMIPPPAQRFMSGRASATTIEVAASHSVYVSQPAAVADLIEQAATATAAREWPQPLSTAQIRPDPLTAAARSLSHPRVRHLANGHQRNSGPPREGQTGRQEEHVRFDPIPASRVPGRSAHARGGRVGARL